MLIVTSESGLRLLANGIMEFPERRKGMKWLNISLFVMFFVSLCSVASAEWQVDFQDTYKKAGIDQAVSDAVKEGIVPDDIVGKGLELEGLNPQNLIKALYCAGIKGDDVKAAADKYGISELVVVAGFKKSKEECADLVADSQAYTQAPGPAFSGVPSPGNPGSSSASPSSL